MLQASPNLRNLRFLIRNLGLTKLRNLRFLIWNSGLKNLFEDPSSNQALAIIQRANLPGCQRALGLIEFK